MIPATDFLIKPEDLKNYNTQLKPRVVEALKTIANKQLESDVLQICALFEFIGQNGVNAIEVSRLEDLFVVHEFEVVSPDGVHELVVRAGWRFGGGRRGWLLFLLVEEHVGRVGLLEGEVEELVGC